MAEFLSKEGQLLVPILEFFAQTELAVDEVVDVMGRTTVETALLMSAEQVAGARTPGKKRAGTYAAMDAKAAW